MKIDNGQKDACCCGAVENQSGWVSLDGLSKKELICTFIWKSIFIVLTLMLFLGPIAIFEKFYLAKTLFYLAFWYLLIVFIDSFRVVKTRTLVRIILLSNSIYLLLNLPYLVVCHHCLDLTAFESVFQTNPREAKEFLASFPIITYLYPVAAFVGTIFITKHKFFALLKTRCKGIKHSLRLSCLVCFMILLMFLLSQCKRQSQFEVMRYFRINVQNVLCWPGFFRDLSKCLDQLNLVDRYHDNLKSYRYESQCLDSGEPKTYVIIVGESLRRDHMSIYGYSRETTPLLNSNHDLVIFEDTIAGANRTITAVPLALTPATVASYELYFKKGSIIQALNEVNFRTYWITAQEKSGRYSNSVTAIASFADEPQFLNDKGKEKDEVLLPVLEKALNEDVSGRSKVIFLHTLGSHANYACRYPEEFNVYSVGDDIEGQVNSYDNTVCYTDWLVNSIVELLEDEDAVLLYFSDHGEELWDTDERLFSHGHPNPTKHSYDIPFFMWFSNQFKASESFQRFDLDQIKHRRSAKYSTQYMFYTIADLAGLRFDGFDPTKSILNADFQECTNRKVLAGNNIQFDYESLPE